jgi:hypothetical protein
MTEYWVIIEGDLVTGIEKIIGPFDSAESANAYADQILKGYNRVVRVEAP